MWTVVKRILSGDKSAQFQIQQMAFMIVALFVFFIIAGLFVLNISLGDIRDSAQDLNTQKAISFLSTLPETTELSYASGSCSGCIDKDKLRVFNVLSSDYRRFLPVDSLRAFKVYPVPSELESDGDLMCPSNSCIILFNSTGNDTQEYSTFVPVCEKSRRTGVVSDRCEIWKLSVGISFGE